MAMRSTILLGILPDVKNGNNAGVVQTPRGLRLIQEPQAKFLFFFGFLSPKRNRFHRDQAVDLGIPGLINDTHSPAAQFSHDLVPAKPLALRILHRVVLEPWLSTCHEAGDGPLLWYLSHRYDSVPTLAQVITPVMPFAMPFPGNKVRRTGRGGS